MIKSTFHGIAFKSMPPTLSDSCEMTRTFLMLLTVDNQQIIAHKVILRSCSPLFRNGKPTPEPSTISEGYPIL